jgi:hypothetical protein
VFEVAPFSNIFPEVTAPGVDIISADHRGSLRALSGTSMACPHVAGVAALWWEKLIKDRGPGQRRPDCVPGHVRFELRNVVAKYPFERSLRFPDPDELWPPETLRV